MPRIAVVPCLAAAVLAAPAAPAGAQAAPPVLGLSLNQNTFGPGDNLALGVSVMNPGGGPSADFYLVIRLPDGATTVSIRPGAPPAFGSLASLRSLRPVAAAVNLGGPFSISQSLFSYTFNGTEPSGTYLVYFAALRSGALGNGLIDAGELLALQTRAFEFTTQPRGPTVTIDQAAVLLPVQGAVRQLTATARDGSGNPFTGPITWTSSHPSQISVSSTGQVEALVANGSSQIVAHAGAATSAPLLVIATTTPAGAVLVTDAQIVGGPVETAPDAPPDADNTYRVVLRDVPPPVVGSLLINTGELPVAGKVVGVSVSGSDVTVTLGLASLPELFPSLTIDETIDLTNAPVIVPEAISAVFTVRRDGNTFTFTPKAGATFEADGDGLRPQADTTVGPFKCKSTVGLPIRLSTPPVISLALNAVLEVLYTPTGGVRRFVVSATPKATFEGGITVTGGFEGNAECVAEMFVLRVPVSGPLSFALSGLVPVDAGFELAGKVTVATFGVKSRLEASAPVEIGVACPPATPCGFVGNIGSPAVRFTPTVDAPSIGDLRLEPSFTMFASATASIGNPLFKSVRADAFKAKIGAKLQGSFAPATSQIADPAYRSSYKVSIETKAGAAAELGVVEKFVTKLLGIPGFTLLEVGASLDLARSPAPAASGAVVASRKSFSAGDTVTFTVRLDPTTVDFLPVVGPYNVRQVALVRGRVNPTVAALLTAQAGQSDFTIPFTSPTSGTADEFSAFIITTLAPFAAFALEVGQATGAEIVVSPPTTSVATGGTATFTAAVTGLPSPQVVWSASLGSITQAGVFTAPTVAGTVTVRATSAVNPEVFGEATVTVTAAPQPFAVLTREAQIGFTISAGSQTFSNNLRGPTVTFPTLTAADGGGSATMADTTASVVAEINGSALDLVLSGRTTLTTAGSGVDGGFAAVDMRTSGSFQALQPLTCTFTVAVQKATSNPNQSWNFLAVVTGPGGEKARLTAAGSTSFACPPGLYNVQAVSPPFAFGGASASLDFTARLAVH